MQTTTLYFAACVATILGILPTITRIRSVVCAFAKPLAVGLVLAISACGGGGGGTAATSPSGNSPTNPTPRNSDALFAVIAPDNIPDTTYPLTDSTQVAVGTGMRTVAQIRASSQGAPQIFANSESDNLESGYAYFTLSDGGGDDGIIYRKGGQSVLFFTDPDEVDSLRPFPLISDPSRFENLLEIVTPSGNVTLASMDGVFYDGRATSRREASFDIEYTGENIRDFLLENEYSAIGAWLTPDLDNGFVLSTRFFGYETPFSNVRSRNEGQVFYNGFSHGTLIDKRGGDPFGGLGDRLAYDPATTNSYYASGTSTFIVDFNSGTIDGGYVVFAYDIDDVLSDGDIEEHDHLGVIALGLSSVTITDNEFSGTPTFTSAFTGDDLGVFAGLINSSGDALLGGSNVVFGNFYGPNAEEIAGRVEIETNYDPDGIFETGDRIGLFFVFSAEEGPNPLDFLDEVPQTNQ